MKVLTNDNKQQFLRTTSVNFLYFFREEPNNKKVKAPKTPIVAQPKNKVAITDAKLPKNVGTITKKRKHNSDQGNISDGDKTQIDKSQSDQKGENFLSDSQNNSITLDSDNRSDDDQKVDDIGEKLDKLPKPKQFIDKVDLTESMLA